MGGVGGALAKHAEEALMQMTQAEQHLVREAFRHLVTSQGTRAILTRLELLQLLGKISDGERVIEKLILARLLVATEGEKGLDRIEIVHEALLNTWPRLVKWQQEDIEGARLRDQLREAARQWQDRGQPKGLLWRDEILAELQLWRSRYIGKLTEIEIAFSNASFAEAAQSQQRKRLLYSSIFIVLLVALVTAFWINYQINNQLVKSYLEQGRNELFNSRPMQAAVYFNEVYKENRDNIPLKMLLGQAMKSVDATQIASFEIPGGVISSSFSPDDKRVLIAGGTTVKVLDIASGKQLLLIDKDLSVNHADFSHDGKLIATADYNQNNIKIWDSFTGNLLRTIDSTGKFTFSYDDKRIACANGKMAQIFDVESGKLLLSLSHPINFTSIVFSPDGSRVVTSNNKTAKVWDLVNGELLLSIEGHTSFIYFSTFSPDGTKIVTASTDKTAKIWDATSGKLLASLEGHKSDVTGIDFSKDGKLIATSSIDKTVKIWDATNNRMLASLALHIGYIWSVNFNKDATQVVTASYDGTAKILDVSKLRVTDSEIIRYSSRATVAEYSKDGRYILTSGDEINLFDATSKKLLRTIKLSNKNVGDLTVARFSPDSKHIVTASFNESPINTSSNLDNNAKVWEVETGKLMLTLSGHKSNIKSVAFSKDGKRIVTAGDDKTAKVWNALTGALELTLIGHNGIIRSAEFSPNGREIVTAGEGNSAKVWDATNGKLLRLLTGHSMELIYAIFSPDGKRIITTSIDATAKIMDAITGQVLFSIDGHSGDVRYCCFSPDGSFIATGSGDGTAKIWDATNGKLLLSLEGHGTWVNMVDFSLDQRYLITASSDTTVKIWGLPQETRTSREIAKVIEQRVPFRFDRGQLIPITNKPISK